MDKISTVTLDRGILTITPRPEEGGPPGAGHPLALAIAQTAVVTVDVQRFFLETPPFAAMQAVVEPLARFLSVARGSGMMVVHVTTEFRPGMDDAGRPCSRTRQMMDGLGGALVRGNPMTEIPETLRDSSDVLVTKTRFSGFARTQLDETLRARGIQSLIFSGGTTTVCVESTLRDATFLEYNALVLSDCVRDITPELQDSALSRIETFFGWVCASTDVIPVLSRSSAAAMSTQSFT